MLSIWWEVKGIIHWKLLSTDCTITADLYCQPLDRVAAKLQGKQYSGDRIYPVSPRTDRNLSKPAARYDHRILVSNSWHFPAGSSRKRGVS
jgi:hypothetical protein